MSLKLVCAAFALALMMLPPAAGADIYAAKAAYEKKDFAAAFAGFRTLAELGHPLAQETVAIMYSTGEGVTRDGMLAYAWARVARENGAGTRAQVIVDQLERFVTPEARKAIDEVHAAFGKQALEERLLPATRDQADTSPLVPTCKMKKPVNPDNYYPKAALKAEISGSVMVETLILPDGRARNPRVWYSVPTNTFEKAGRQIALATEFEPALAPENGAALPCTIVFSAYFSMPDVLKNRTLMDQVERLKTSAERGDPSAQLHYATLMSSWRQLNPNRKNFSSMFVQAAQAGLPVAQYIVGVKALRIRQDREKGVRWLEMAAEAGQANAQVALANELLRETPGKVEILRARELLGNAVTSGSQDARFYLADLQVGDPDPTRRDPRRALELLDELSRDEDPSTHELRAAALSQLGDFTGAIKNQERALESAQKLKWEVRPQAERLAMYENNQAWAGMLLTY